MVVEDDVDATNLTEALHSTMSRTHPSRGLQIFGLAPGHPLVPFLDLHTVMFVEPNPAPAKAALAQEGTS